MLDLQTTCYYHLTVLVQIAAKAAITRITNVIIVAITAGVSVSFAVAAITIAIIVIAVNLIVIVNAATTINRNL